MSTELVLKSGIHKEYKKDFVLTEDIVHRIVEILKKAAKNLGYNTAIVFYVYKKDDRFYETLDVEEPLRDPNVLDKEIVLFRIELRNTNPERKPEPWEYDWIVSIEFAKEENKPILVKIYGEDKGWALLLADEIEPHVIRSQVRNGISDFILIPLYTSLSFLGFNSLSSVIGKSPIPNGLVYAMQALIILAVVAASLVTLNIWKRRAKFLRNYIGPESVFLWGAQSSSYRSRQTIRHSIFWSVIIGFLVSLVANAVFAIK